MLFLHYWHLVSSGWAPRPQNTTMLKLACVKQEIAWKILSKVIKPFHIWPLLVLIDIPIYFCIVWHGLWNFKLYINVGILKTGCALET